MQKTTLLDHGSLVTLLHTVDIHAMDGTTYAACDGLRYGSELCNHRVAFSWLGYEQTVQLHATSACQDRYVRYTHVTSAPMHSTGV